mmetsp:Transcript_24997/g.78492  ORF Transcript_24997/g.78492 Transcript_24997/m.78492 type:complete len:219 (-) Transcript_24997:1-657(-)
MKENAPQVRPRALWIFLSGFLGSICSPDLPKSRSRTKSMPKLTLDESEEELLSLLLLLLLSFFFFFLPLDFLDSLARFASNLASFLAFFASFFAFFFSFFARFFSFFLSLFSLLADLSSSSADPSGAARRRGPSSALPLLALLGGWLPSSSALAPLRGLGEPRRLRLEAPLLLERELMAARLLAPCPAPGRPCRGRGRRPPARPRAGRRERGRPGREA